MTYKEQSEILMSAIQLLMQLYQDISKRTDSLACVWDSEVKKIPSPTGFFFYKQETSLRKQGNTTRQKRQFWNFLKRSYLKCRNFSETNSN